MTSLVSNPGSLTKDRLKAELRSHNITLPRQDSKKEVYVELYRRHLLRSEFSSDDDDAPLTPPRNRKRPNVPKGKMPGKKADSATMDVFSLSDADLADNLRSFGVDVGPILESTRKVLQKKLQKLLTEEVKAEARAPAQAEPEEEFSDEDETEVVRASASAPSRPTSSYRQTRVIEESTYDAQDVRRRQVGSSTPSKSQRKPSPGRTSPRRARYTEPEPEEEEEEEEIMDVGEEEEEELEDGEPYEEEEGEDVVDFRGQVSSVNYRTAARLHANSITTQAKPPPPTQVKAKKGYSIWLQLGILLVVGIIIFLIIQNMEPANKIPVGKIGEV